MSKRPHNFFSFTVAALASAVALAAFTPGCSDEPTGDDTCHDYSAFNSTSRLVTFKTDVLPIFRNSCGFVGSCHGSPTPPNPRQTFLGPPKLDPDPTQAEIDKIFAQNVDVNASQASTMKIVAKGSPQTSFLMHKMDNTLKCADVVCEAGCGSSMPLANPILGETDLETVRLWIAQGAKND